MMLSLGSSLRTNTLTLSSRGLTEVPLAEIEPLAGELSTLDLSKNTLSAPLTLPRALPKLVSLSLADNTLDAATVQRAAPLPASLRVLDLGANRITVLPPAVLRLSKLSVLKVDRQQLRSLPPQLSLLTELVELDAGFNELEAALVLHTPGLPRLRRLVLRSNALARATLEFDADALPSLVELDLAGNGLAAWPVAVGALTSLRTLCLSNNRLASLVSGDTMPHKRMWVPSAGVHTLPQLSELALAQNALIELPASLVELRALVRLDVRCNPLSAQAVQLATSHCDACHARLDCTSLRRAAEGLLLGDESSAWHRPTALKAHVSRVLSVGALPTDGVPAARLIAQLPQECALMGIGGEVGGGKSGGGEGGGSGPVVTVEGLRRAFRACALREHPDKQQQLGVEHTVAAARFARLQAAYRTLGKAVATERRRLPEFEEIVYGFVDLPEGTSRSTSVDAAEATRLDSALSAAFRSQLPSALAFAAEARRAKDGELLIHSSSRAPSAALAVVLAILIDKGESTVDGAGRALWGSGLDHAGKSAQQRLAELPPSLRQELELLASERRASQLQISHDEGSRVPADAPTPSAFPGANLTICDPFAAETAPIAMEKHVPIRLDDATAPPLSAIPEAEADAADDAEEIAGTEVTIIHTEGRNNASSMPSLSTETASRAGGGGGGGGGRRYNPVLSVVDPFSSAGLDIDPFANLNADTDADVRYQTLSPVPDDMATGGMPPPPLPEAVEATATLDLDTDPMGLSGSFDATDPMGEAPSARPGWHVDSHGRDVFTLPERAPSLLGGRYVFSHVVVEHEPGARVGGEAQGEGTLAARSSAV